MAWEQLKTEIIRLAKFLIIGADGTEELSLTETAHAHPQRIAMCLNGWELTVFKGKVELMNSNDAPVKKKVGI